MSSRTEQEGRDGPHVLASAVLLKEEERTLPRPSQSRQMAISEEFLRLTCIVNIRKSTLSISASSETGHKYLSEEIALCERRLKAIAFEFRVKDWLLPDYEAWRKTGVYARRLHE